MAHLQISAKSPQEGAKNADPWHKARSKQNPEFESKWRCATKCYIVLVTVDVYRYRCGGLSLSPSPCWAQSADPPSLVLLLITVLICPNISHQGCRTRSGQIVAPNISSFSWKQSMPHLPTAVCFCWPCCSACTQCLGDCWASALSLAFCLTYVYDLWAWRRLHLKPWSKMSTSTSSWQK